MRWIGNGIRIGIIGIVIFAQSVFVVFSPDMFPSPHGLILLFLAWSVVVPVKEIFPFALISLLVFDIVFFEYVGVSLLLFLLFFGVFFGIRQYFFPTKEKVSFSSFVFLIGVFSLFSFMVFSFVSFGSILYGGFSLWKFLLYAFFQGFLFSFFYFLLTRVERYIALYTEKDKKRYIQY